jgi:hypothetical protein
MGTARDSAVGGGVVIMGDDEKFRKAIDGQRIREGHAARERARRGESPGEFAEEVTAILCDGDGRPKAVVTYEVGAGWVPDSPEDHVAEN